jgi:hypothetical protein
MGQAAADRTFEAQVGWWVGANETNIADFPFGVSFRAAVAIDGQKMVGSNRQRIANLR